MSPPSAASAVLTKSEARSTAPAAATDAKAIALSSTARRREAPKCGAGPSVTRQMALRDVFSSEKTPLAPKTSVAVPINAPTPRAVWCVCIPRMRVVEKLARGFRESARDRVDESPSVRRVVPEEEPQDGDGDDHSPAPFDARPSGPELAAERRQP